MNICFDTFGCRLNRAEALDDEARAIAKGYRVVESHAEADVIVVRGCSVTSRAQRDCERLIAHIRRKYPNKRLLVTGCLAEAKPLSIVAKTDAVPTRTSRAYLKVQDGCSGRCTFCIIPKFRGKSAAEPFAAVLDKAKRFIDAGYHEIVVTGCNLSLYASEGKRLPELLVALAGLASDCRVRLGSLEPGPVAEAVVDAIAETPNICRFLHIPVQSGSERILQAMGRPYTVKTLDGLLNHIADRLPLVGLGCDVIAGFPGETEIDHFATIGFLKRHGFVNIHAFPYSQRPGTIAATLPEMLDREERSRRAHELASASETARIKFLRRFLGAEVQMVVEQTQPLGGWTGEYVWLECPHHEVARREEASWRKQLKTFKVTGVVDGHLEGVLI